LYTERFEPCAGIMSTARRGCRSHARGVNVSVIATWRPRPSATSRSTRITRSSPDASASALRNSGSGSGSGSAQATSNATAINASELFVMSTTGNTRRDRAE
jgi:hypothetical protein